MAKKIRHNKFRTVVEMLKEYGIYFTGDRMPSVQAIVKAIADATGWDMSGELEEMNAKIDRFIDRERGVKPGVSRTLKEYVPSKEMLDQYERCKELTKWPSIFAGKRYFRG